MKKIALLFIGGLIVGTAFQQGYAEASKRGTPTVQAAHRAAYGIAAAPAAPFER